VGLPGVEQIKRIAQGRRTEDYYPFGVAPLLTLSDLTVTHLTHYKTAAEQSGCPLFAFISLRGILLAAVGPVMPVETSGLGRERA